MAWLTLASILTSCSSPVATTWPILGFIHGFSHLPSRKQACMTSCSMCTPQARGGAATRRRCVRGSGRGSGEVGVEDGEMGFGSDGDGGGGRGNKGPRTLMVPPRRTEVLVQSSRRWTVRRSEVEATSTKSVWEENASGRCG